MHRQQVGLGRRALHQIVAAAVALALAGPTFAAERGLSVTDFDRLVVNGSYVVEVTLGTSTSARIVGASAAIEATSVAVQGRTLTIQRNRSAWGGFPSAAAPAPPVVRLTVPRLQTIAATGPAVVRVDTLRGQRLGISLQGTGNVTVGTVTSDRLDVGLIGSGKIVLGGRVADASMLVRGAGDIDAEKLLVADLKVTSESAGSVVAAARRTANVTATGSGSVTIVGKPACTVRNVGAGSVTCGADKLGGADKPGGSDQPERR